LESMALGDGVKRSGREPEQRPMAGPDLHTRFRGRIRIVNHPGSGRQPRIAQ
jgi:hypothetical protein